MTNRQASSITSYSSSGRSPSAPSPERWLPQLPVLHLWGRKINFPFTCSILGWDPCNKRQISKREANISLTRVAPITWEKPDSKAAPNGGLESPLRAPSTRSDALARPGQAQGKQLRAPGPGRAGLREEARGMTFAGKFSGLGRMSSFLLG